MSSRPVCDCSEPVSTVPAFIRNRPRGSARRRGSACRGSARRKYAANLKFDSSFCTKNKDCESRLCYDGECVDIQLAPDFRNIGRSTRATSLCKMGETLYDGECVRIQLAPDFSKIRRGSGRRASSNSKYAGNTHLYNKMKECKMGETWYDGECVRIQLAPDFRNIRRV